MDPRIDSRNYCGVVTSDHRVCSMLQITSRQALGSGTHEHRLGMLHNHVKFWVTIELKSGVSVFLSSNIFSQWQLLSTKYHVASSKLLFSALWCTRQDGLDGDKQMKGWTRTWHTYPSRELTM